MGLKKIRFMDTSFRDGFQSVFGARVRTKDFLPAIKASVEAGIDHFEFGGGARFQSLFFYCQESAFDMMDRVRLAVGPDINLQTLARGINVVGLSQQPKDIINLHAKLFKKHGTTTIRNFDALNDTDNLNYSGHCIHNADLKHQIAITLMGLPPGIQDKSVHSAEFYMEKLNEILDKEIPFDSIVFKDASGTCPPEVVYETVKKARARVGKNTTLWFHTHDTAGLGTISIMAAIRAGIDGIDLAQSPVSSGTAQPDILSVWHALRTTEYTLDIDYKKILRAETIFEECMDNYLIPPEAKRTSPNIVLSPMPGGALTANTMMMRDTNTLHLYPKVIKEMAEVVKKGGFGTSVTPVSQFYFQQAFTNVTQGKWKKITDGYGNMVLGYYGKTPRKPDAEIIKLAKEQLGKPEFTGSPIEILNQGIPEAKKNLLEHNLPVDDENIFIVATCKDKGINFLKGNSPLSIYFKERRKEKKQHTENHKKDRIENLIVNVDGKDFKVSVKPDKDNSPQILHKKPVKGDEKSAKTGDQYIKSPLTGIITKILVEKGDKVNDGDVVAIIEAMKMESDIVAHVSGNVKNIKVSVGKRVKEEQELFVIGE